MDEIPALSERVSQLTGPFPTKAWRQMDRKRIERSEFSRMAAVTFPKKQCLACRPAHPHDDQIVAAEANLPQDGVLGRDVEA